jgi:hypothetical protein
VASSTGAQKGDSMKSSGWSLTLAAIEKRPSLGRTATSKRRRKRSPTQPIEMLLLRRSSRSVTSSPRFLAARDCGLDHPGSMSLALKTGAEAGAVRNLISDLAASACLLAFDTHAMKTR